MNFKAEVREIMKRSEESGQHPNIEMRSMIERRLGLSADNDVIVHINQFDSLSCYCEINFELSADELDLKSNWPKSSNEKVDVKDFLARNELFK